MSRTVTLAQLRTDVASLCDFTEGASTRYTPTLLNRLINQSIQRFRGRISSDGLTHFLTSSSGVLAGPTSPYAFEVLNLSALPLVQTYGLDVTIQGIVRTLAHRPFTERNDYSDNGHGIPACWAQYQTTTIAVMPSRHGDPYTLWYLPLLADLVNDSDTFDGVAGWENWVVWDVVCQLAARDQYEAASAQFSILRDGVWQDIIRAAPRVTAAGGSTVGRDTVRRAARGPAGASAFSSGPTGPTGPAGSGGGGSAGLSDVLMLMGG